MYEISLSKALSLKSCQTEWQLRDGYDAWSKIVVTITGDAFIASSGLCLLGYGEMNPKAAALFNEFLNAVGAEMFHRVVKLNDSGKHNEALMLAINGLVDAEVAILID